MISSLRGLALSLVIVLFIPSLSAVAQKRKKQKNKVEILHADELNIDHMRHLKRLEGNVRLKHQEVILSCDSALVYDFSNVVEAYSNVTLTQGDTLFLYGDFIRYDGDRKNALVEGQVRLLDQRSQLTTDRLNVDLTTNIGYYLTGGVIEDDSTRIESVRGYYHSDTKDYYFKDSVHITTPQYEIFSDSMIYNTETDLTRFSGPTRIVGDSMEIYCESGWYNRREEIFRFVRHAEIITPERTVRGDTIYYVRATGYGRVRGHAQLIDTARKVILTGELAVYYTDPEHTLMTGRALFRQYDENGDTMYMHADTMRSFLDTAGSRVMIAYYGVRIYRKDLQGVCDSLAYSFADSVIHLYTAPVIWSGENQLNADKMDLFTKDQAMDHFEMHGKAMIVSRYDSIRYNQIKGKKMYGYFRENELYRIDVNGNGESIYYPEDNGRLIGMNRAECSNIVIYVEKRRIKKIKLLKSPTGTLNPPPQKFSEDQRLKGFKWLSDLRPAGPWDLFRETKKKNKKTANDQKKKRAAPALINTHLR